jgi:hypothetical protein
LEEAQQIAKLKKKPYAIYFATKDEFKAIGENAETIKQFAAANHNSLPSTVFDLPKVIDQFRSMGVVEFVKVVNNKENREMVNKYGGGNQTLVVLDPDGSKLGAWSIGSSNVSKLVESAKVALAPWQKKDAQPATTQ